jgi:hypothetical protein
MARPLLGKDTLGAECAFEFMPSLTANETIDVMCWHLVVSQLPLPEPQ